MAERIDTVVIGAGHAGLSVSYHLTQHGREHVVLERGRVAETWRSERWDGFYLNTPNWAQRLPGFEYSGDEPDAFAPLAEVIAYLDDYAESFGAPVRTGVEVHALRPDRNGGYVVEADGEALRAANVVVATGSFQRPTPRPLADGAPGDLLQLHTSEYRAPDRLPAGAVLIVGSGQSGCQIADELLDAGRRVYLSVGRCPWIRRRYRGHEIVHWMIEAGLMDDTVDKLPSPAARFACNPPVSGNGGGHDCNPVWLARRGAVLLGRLEGFRGRMALFASDLAESLAKGHEFVAALTRRIDDHVRERGLDVPEDEPSEAPGDVAAPRELDLAGEEVGTIVWANGFRPAYGWIDLPVVGADGWPVQTRGVTSSPGLYFVGVNWLHKRKSALFLGVGEDAEHVATHLAARA